MSTGIRKILNALEKNGSPPPEFKTSQGREYMQVTIKMHEGFNIDHFATKTPGDDFGVKDGVINGMKDGVNESQAKIIALIKKNSRVTIPQMAQLSGLSVRTVQREIKVLVDNMIVVREGGRRAGTWEVRQPEVN
jgi:ATP-dependent DNA helicase RecG